MKKIISISILVFVSTIFSVNSQSIIPGMFKKKKEILDSKKLVICNLGQEGIEFDNYRSVIENAEDIWTYSEYKIASKEEVSSLDVSKHVFLSLDKFSYTDVNKGIEKGNFIDVYSLAIRNFDTQSELIEFVNDPKRYNINKGKKQNSNSMQKNNVQGGGFYYGMEVRKQLTSAMFMEKEVTYSTLYNIISSMNSFPSYTGMKKKEFRPIIKENSKALKTKTLLIRETDLKKLTLDDIIKDYPYKVELCNDETMGNALKTKSEDHAVLQLGDSYVFFIIDASTHKNLWYFQENYMQAYSSGNMGTNTSGAASGLLGLYTEKKRAGFSPKKLKSLVEFLNE